MRIVSERAAPCTSVIVLEGRGLQTESVLSLETFATIPEYFTTATPFERL